MKQLSSTSKTLDDVYQFWNDHPLFAGESEHEPGSKAWFQEHERVYINDCFAGHQPDPIFTNGLTHESRILDVGCGPGFWVRYFLRSGFKHVSACDLTPKAIEMTNKSLKLFGLRADVQIGNAEQLPYEDSTFDHINCQGVIHHTPHPEQCIKEFYRVLKPGGTLCFSVYHKNFLLRHPKILKFFSRIFARSIKLKGRGREALLTSGEPNEIVRMYDGQDNPIGKAYTLEELQTMIKDFFEVEEVGLFYFPARSLPIRIPRFLHQWLHKNLGLMIIVRGKKYA